MELGKVYYEGKKFSSPEEEISFLRQEIKKREILSGKIGDVPNEEVIKGAVKDYSLTPHEEVIEEKRVIRPEEAGSIVLELAPETHDKQIEKLIGVLHDHGLRNALHLVEKLKNPHLEDDFHRFIVQYIKAGYSATGLKENNELWKPSHMTLYEITLPEVEKEDAREELKKFISGMEQFYAGMLGGASEEDYFTVEIANANGSDEFVFYIGVGDNRKELFEKQIHSLFAGVKIREEKNDYNIFNSEGVSVGAYAALSKNAIFPLKTYENFDVDPLSVIMNSFSKIDRDGEGAAIQFVIKPAKSEYSSKWKKALSELEKGVPTYTAVDVPFTVGGKIMKVISELVSPTEKKKKNKDEPNELPKTDQTAIENVKVKIGSPIILSTVRVIASANDTASAREIMSHIEAAFAQFENAGWNRLTFREMFGGKLRRLLHEFSWRMFSSREEIPINIKELTTLMHFPTSHMKAMSPELKKAEAGVSPAPTGLPESGTLIGVNKARGEETKIFVTEEDRLRHFYVVGQTGTGKTTLLKNMIVQDIERGAGVCMIDPHGSDIEDVLAQIPKSRYEDVIYFDPSYVERPMGLNMLEFDRRYPEQKIFVVNEMLSIFEKLFDLKQTGGPMFEQYFRNSVLLALEDPDSGSTLLDVARVLSNKAYRDYKISKCVNPIVIQFWKEVAEKAGGEASLQNIVPYVTSKFDNFLANDIMRPIIAQQKSSFNLREVMDSKKILLVNLAKGRLGELNSHLLGLVIVGKILMAALSRVDSLGSPLPNFYLYIDEFQNVTTDSISVILSEARKYKLGLNIAHQFIGQLTDKIKGSVFGNVGTIASFRVGPEDAEFLEKQFTPVFSARDVMNLNNRNAYVRLLAHGRPVRPFNMETLAPKEGNIGNIAKLKQLSYLKYGRDRIGVEAEIMERYKK
ncbi:MAG: hypothetical protein A3H57_04115 [Candidatus Taylorbacteria bacterium RIFCSPLOWO2_02_FULL_43_11]|uniref:Uncharacterized protein n=1 Tax=Candidatus Taylorbacteria bacterium RIFCSPHIGHO2_02_FULL_43_32b TaxID=1802306 RepID=A0A1G2MHK0_9BACT|nr:MAG: hypothetical protein A2743_04210 [Candidatus Taylorbacteria bacterium RIFCSPHIGHO2_01_FULL_43_47]OHA23313.1 MAG: hypothetical protein A3C72_04630 [Candidatus Taylorbacteria bacterium RIFCSPHIGHO2_02_FULL_43_32b]OHA30181.1 MAG: hypothetical protein A3B08_03760 [Candidatus Taylorbacteria bacterium RIFCSPLOWO2_01_FULL_43_44]OHA36010.1 MAG: hypothetical protein A3H57_04115 [Candidatus Taylorbacteria bacterium RIFCSPLOWO2_02_FULL_43_11]